jgi:hypothetical protein
MGRTPSTEPCLTRHLFCKSRSTRCVPDDSREADERAAKRRVRDVRGRVKAARAALTATPGAAEVLRQDWVMAARFYARFGVTETQFREGVPIASAPDGAELEGDLRLCSTLETEARERAAATLQVGCKSPFLIHFQYLRRAGARDSARKCRSRA